MKSQYPQNSIATLEAPESLLDWWPKEDVKHVEGLLAEPPSDNPAELYQQLSDLSAWQGRILTLLADANSLLDYA